ncbi:protein Wnt-11b-1-like isoform X2 [Anthonomus grandis grandis]|uniref:protein Wnt-11b-1-like isoform X2 n=1 Tax=Anthonomus grandis grandis TaxID=2921223 RepID=UPI002165C498|nr:protein Wnt-11b-1-like isoform X2 [Anthonomus grandis grandis]
MASNRKKWFYMISFVGLLFLDIVAVVECIKWLSLQHSHLNWNLSSNNNHARGIRSGVTSPCALARRKYGLVKIQAKLCRGSMEVMPHIQNAALLTTETCQLIFNDRRWNCSSIAKAPHLTPDLTRATREQAYVYALSSATLTHTLARACASGNLHQCTCAGRPTNPNTEQFQWGGCGDNVRWASQFSKKFVDNMEKKSLEKREKSKEEGSKVAVQEAVAVINLHNNKVGRKMISGNLKTQCKCHGVSGSCNIKTCWKALVPIQEIGKQLLQKYTNAREVSRGIVNKLDSKVNSKKVLSADQLIYLTKSPDYCTKDEKLGSFGTVGRHCNVSSTGLDSCRILCCGRGYRTVVEEKIERCQCKFYNCCYVKCKICRTKTKVFECS